MRKTLLLVASLAAVTTGRAPADPIAPPSATANTTTAATLGGIVTEDVTFASGGITLAGRLWRPAGPGPHPAVVFIPGSGKSIRDLQLDPDPVPPHFVSAGVAFFAWDKRGVRDSGGTFVPLPDRDAEAQLARLRLLAADAVAAMRTLAARPDIDGERVGVWAFSQGGWVAPQVESVGGRPRFVIVVGGPAVSIGEELRYSALADAARAASRAGEGRVDLDAIYARLEADRPEGGFGGYDPLPFLDAMTAPTLFLLGADDLSVPTRRSVDRLEALGARRAWIDHRVFPRANHGVATQDAAGQWYIAEAFYETQLDFLGNLGIVDRSLRFRIAVDRKRP